MRVMRPVLEREQLTCMSFNKLSSLGVRRELLFFYCSIVVVFYGGEIIYKSPLYHSTLKMVADVGFEPTVCFRIGLMRPATSASLVEPAMKLVPREGFEPPRITSLVSKTSASASSASRALNLVRRPRVELGCV